jgi:hypothetical protein
MRGSLIFEQCGTNPIVMLRKTKEDELPNTSNVGLTHIIILTSTRRDPASHLDICYYDFCRLVLIIMPIFTQHCTL